MKGVTLALLAGVALGTATGAAAGAAAGASSASLDDVMARYAAAHGGRARWQAMRSLTLRGTQTAFSEPAPFTLRLGPGRYRLDQHFMAADVVYSLDGDRAWWLLPVSGSQAWASRAPAAEAAWMRRDAGTDLPLWRYRDGGARLELVGEHDFDGQEAVEVRVIFAQGDEETWYLSPTTGLEIARRFTGSDFGVPGEWWAYFSDFRAVEGLTLPFVVELEGMTRYVRREIQTVAVDQPLADADFRMPATAGMERLASLVGVWSVALELKASPRSPAFQPPIELTSAVVGSLDGNLLTERFTWDQAGTLTDVERQYTFDAARGVFRCTEINNTVGLLDVFEGPLTEGPIVVSNTATAGSQPGQSHQRYHLLDLTAGGFRLEVEQSFDGGVTWVTMGRATYTKKAQP